MKIDLKKKIVEKAYDYLEYFSFDKDLNYDERQYLSLAIYFLLRLEYPQLLSTTYQQFIWPKAWRLYIC